LLWTLRVLLEGRLTVEVFGPTVVPIRFVIVTAIGEQFAAHP